MDPDNNYDKISILQLAANVVSNTPDRFLTGLAIAAITKTYKALAALIEPDKK